VDDAQRYRVNAAEWLSAAERCEPAYRDLTFAITVFWLSLARHQEALDDLLRIWSKAQCATHLVVGLLRCERRKQFPPKWIALRSGLRHAQAARGGADNEKT
jgi:hypothetical protein